MARVLMLLGILASVLALPRTPWGQQHLPRSYEEFERQVQSFAPYDQIAYVALYAVGTVFLLPGTLLSFAGATLFGTWLGTVLTWLGAVIGSSLVFGIVRWLGREPLRPTVDRLLAGRFDSFDRWVARHGFQALLVARLLPIFPFNGINVASGMTSVSWGTYVAATAVGILPGTFVYQYLFANIGPRALKEGLSWSDLADPRLLLPVGVFVLFLLVGRWAARRQTRLAEE
jgi:uncharacterized membrane protein YdjX (TVP38/TMEM64 family)